MEVFITGGGLGDHLPHVSWFSYLYLQRGAYALVLLLWSVSLCGSCTTVEAVGFSTTVENLCLLCDGQTDVCGKLVEFEGIRQSV